MSQYQLSSSLRYSPESNQKITIYLDCPPYTLELSSILVYTLKDIQKLSDSFSEEELKNTLISVLSEVETDNLIKKFIELDVIIPYSESASEIRASSQSALVSQQQHSNPGLLLFSIQGSRFENFLQGFTASIIAVQRKILLPVLSTYILLVFQFFFSPNSPWRDLFLDSQSVAVTYRLTISLLFVNFLGVTASLLSTYALGGNSNGLRLRFLWGFIPRFSWSLNSKLIKENSSQQNYLLYVAQPLIVRIYLMIAIIFAFYLRLPNIQMGYFELYPSLITIFYASFGSLIILLLPFRDSPGKRILAEIELMPKNYLRLSFQRTKKLFESLIVGNLDKSLFQRDLVLSYGFIFTLFGLVALKISLLASILIPSLLNDLPNAFGPQYRAFFNIVLLILVFNFVNKKFFAKLWRQSELKSKDQIVQWLYVKGKQWPKKTYLLLACILFFPYPSTAVGTFELSSNQSVQIRASHPSSVVYIATSTPESKLIKKGTKILQLSSQILEADIEATQQAIHAFQKQISEVKIERGILTKGSNLLRQDLSKINISKIQSESEKLVRAIADHELKLEIVKDSYKTALALYQDGAMSRTQLKTIELDLRDLESQLNLIIYESKINAQELIAAQTQDQIDSQVSIEEQLMSLDSRLKFLELDLSLERSKLEKLALEQQQLSVLMPFDGFIKTDTRGLQYSSYLKGEEIVQLVQVPMNLLEAKLPEYMRSSLQINQSATSRFYSSPFTTFTAKIVSINPSAINDNGISYASVILESDDVPNKMSLGSNGTIKIFNGITCLLASILKPVFRFVLVDIWSWLP